MKVAAILMSLAVPFWLNTARAGEITTKVISCSMTEVVDGAREVLPHNLSFSVGFDTEVPGLKGSSITIGQSRSVIGNGSPFVSAAAVTYRIKLSQYTHSDVEVPRQLLLSDSGVYPIQIRTWPDDGSRSSVVNYTCGTRALVD